jgi:hypothetical protein
VAEQYQRPVGQRRASRVLLVDGDYAEQEEQAVYAAAPQGGSRQGVVSGSEWIERARQHADGLAQARRRLA